MATVDSRGFASAPGTTTSGIQEAIDALPPEGGDVPISGGVLTASTTIYTPCDRPCNLIGEGAGADDTHGTVIVNAAGTDIIRLRGDYSSIRGIRVSGAGSSAAANEETGRGIVIGRRAVTDPHPGTLSPGTEVAHGGGSVLKNVLLDDVRIASTAGWGLFIAGTEKLSDGSTSESNATANVTLSIYTTMRRVHCTSPAKYGGLFIGRSNTTARFEDCSFTGVGAGKGGADAYYAYLNLPEKVVFDHCTFEGLNPGTKSWLRLLGFSLTLRDCWIEEDPGDAAGTPGWFMEIIDLSQDIAIINPHFHRGGTTSAGKRRLITFPRTGSSTCYGALISNIYAQIDVTPYTAGVWTEQNDVDFVGNNNQDVTVHGTGSLWDTAASQHLPIQYANIPTHSSFVGGEIIKYPQLSIAERDATTRFTWPNGAIISVTDGTSPGPQIRYGGAWYHLTKTVNAAGD